MPYLRQKQLFHRIFEDWAGVNPRLRPCEDSLKSGSHSLCHTVCCQCVFVCSVLEDMLEQVPCVPSCHLAWKAVFFEQAGSHGC